MASLSDWIIMKSNTRVVILSPCILSPGLQAERKQGVHWGTQFIELLLSYGTDFYILPCPESTFGGYASGLQRGKHGIDYYSSLKGYLSHCSTQAERVAEDILSMHVAGCQFVCILGVEHSPTCAVNYMYSHKGMIKRRGLFLDALHNELEKNKLKIPQIGINRTYPKKALALLEQVLSCSTRDLGEGG